MKYLKYLLIAIVALIIGYSYFATIAGQGPKVIVKPHPKYKETSYLIIDQDQRQISLTTYQTELNQGILRLRSKSALPLKQQVDLISRILDRVLKDENKAELHTLFIGRLVNAFGQDKTLSDRLALAAANSPLWDKRRGKPVSGHENKAVKMIANQAEIYPELKSMFKKHSLVIKVTSVEKVLISRADKTPYDCLTWFSLKEL